MRHIIFVLLVVLLGTNIGYAGSGSTGYIEIRTIRVGGGFLRVTSTSEFSDPSSCSGSSSISHILISEDTPSYNEIVSFVLSAKMANRKVNFWVKGCGTDSGNSYPKGLYAYM